MPKGDAEREKDPFAGFPPGELERLGLLRAELGNLAKQWSVDALDHARRAVEAMQIDGDEKRAIIFEGLADKSRIDALTAAYEAGQISRGGPRDGKIPTLTEGLEIKKPVDQPVETE